MKILFNSKYARVLIYSFLITTVSLLSGTLGWNYQFVLVGTSFFIGGLLYSRKYDLNPVRFSLIILLPFLGIYDGLVFYDQLMHVYPIAIIPVVTYLAGLFLNLFSTGFKKILLSTVIIVTIGIVGYAGMSNWLSYVFNKNQVTVENENAEILFYNANNETLSLLQLPHEIVILDFWTTSCGICFKKFPELQELYDKYKPDDRVGIYAVNLLLKNQELEFVKENKHLMKYTFPQLYTSFEYSKNIQKHFDFNKVPTVVIIDDGRLIYRGQLNIKDYILVNNTIDFIENALNNEK